MIKVPGHIISKMANFLNEEIMRSETIAADNSDGVLRNIKTFFGHNNGLEKEKTKRDIKVQNGGSEICNSNGPGRDIDHIRQGETNDRSETGVTPVAYYEGYIISRNEQNDGLVFTRDGKAMETDKHDEMRVEDDDDDDDDDEYKLNHKKRGYMIQVLNDYHNRSGAQKDLRKMTEIGQKLGFECFNSDNSVDLSKQDMQSVLKLAQQTDHTNCDCFLFMISCHGAEGQRSRPEVEEDYGLLFADEEVMFVGEIIRMFNDYNCPTLKGKPKLFFIQACRGPQTDDGNPICVLDCDNTKECNIERCHTDHCRGTEWDKKDANILNNSETNFLHANNAFLDSDEDVTILNCENDMLVMFAAPRDMMAWRSEANGSWMIHHLHKAFMDYNFAQPKSLLRLLTKVIGQISRLETHMSDPSLNKKTVMPVIEHKLTKDIIF